MPNTLKGTEVSKQRTGFCISSSFQYYYDYIEYAADFNIRSIYPNPQSQSINAKQSSHHPPNDHCSVTELQQINWIAKNTAAVREGSMTYFLTSRSPGLTRLDFLSVADMRDFVVSVKVLYQSILVQTVK